jgi:hypothetical protein
VRGAAVHLAPYDADADLESTRHQLAAGHDEPSHPGFAVVAGHGAAAYHLSMAASSAPVASYYASLPSRSPPAPAGQPARFHLVSEEASGVPAGGAGPAEGEGGDAAQRGRTRSRGLSF